MHVFGSLVFVVCGLSKNIVLYVVKLYVLEGCVLLNKKVFVPFAGLFFSFYVGVLRVL